MVSAIALHVHLVRRPAIRTYQYRHHLVHQKNQFVACFYYSCFLYRHRQSKAENGAFNGVKTTGYTNELMNDTKRLKSEFIPVETLQHQHQHHILTSCRKPFFVFTKFFFTTGFFFFLLVTKKNYHQHLLYFIKREREKNCFLNVFTCYKSILLLFTFV